MINPGSASIKEISYTLDASGIIKSAPVVKLVSNGFSKEYRIGCVYYEGKKLSFENDLNYCITIIPYIMNDRINELGGVLLQSEKVHKTLFAKLYINNENLNEYSLEYTDSRPLALYNGRIVGPIKIWSINYSGMENNVKRFTNIEEFIKYHPANGINTI